MTVSTLIQPDHTAQNGNPYKGNIDGAIMVLVRLAASFAPHQQTTPVMTVRLDAGHIPKVGAKATEVAAQDTGTIAAPSSNPRKDIVYVDSASGAGGVATGAEAASPVDPAVPSGKVAVARINLTTSTTEITNADLDDLRNLGMFNIGTSAGNLIALETGAKLPAVDGSQLTGVGNVDAIQPIDASVAANALTLNLDPTKLDFRSSTLGSGAVNTRTVSSQLSLVISSGSTLGTVNAIQSRIAILAIDNAGTIELAAVNLAGGNNLDETTLISTTAEGGAGGADTANVIYSTTARTNVPFRVVGYVESTQATAGTWVTAPSTVQGYGGQALAAMSSIGYSQTWQNVTRTSGTTYYNTTGKPILLAFSGQIALPTMTVHVNGFQAYYGTGTPTYNDYTSGTLIIPPQAAYYMTYSGTLTSCTELR